jgi:hypothetical protein
MMMLEKNSDQVAQVIADWLDTATGADAAQRSGHLGYWRWRSREGIGQQTEARRRSYLPTAISRHMMRS